MIPIISGYIWIFLGLMLTNPNRPVIALVVGSAAILAGAFLVTEAKAGDE